MDLVEVNLVVSKGASKRKIEAILEKQLKARFGNKTQFNFNFVDSIERTKGGKKIYDK